MLLWVQHKPASQRLTRCCKAVRTPGSCAGKRHCKGHGVELLCCSTELNMQGHALRPLLLMQVILAVCWPLSKISTSDCRQSVRQSASAPHPEVLLPACCHSSFERTGVHDDGYDASENWHYSSQQQLFRCAAHFVVAAAALKLGGCDKRANEMLLLAPGRVVSVECLNSAILVVYASDHQTSKASINWCAAVTRLTALVIFRVHSAQGSGVYGASWVVSGCQRAVFRFSLSSSPQHLQSSMAEVSAHDFLRQQGATFVVFHPCENQLVLGIGCSDQPLVLPACIAYRRKPAENTDQQKVRSPDETQQPQHLQTQHPAWPHQQAYEALSQVRVASCGSQTLSPYANARIAQVACLHPSRLSLDPSPTAACRFNACCTCQHLQSHPVYSTNSLSSNSSSQQPQTSFPQRKRVW